MKKLILIYVFNLFSFAGFNQQIHEIKFSHNRGIYFKEFDLEIKYTDPDAKILFTTNGCEPTLKNAKFYSSPIHIDSTTIIKAIAFINDSDISETQVHTFLFLEDIVKQPKEINNYPTNEYPANGIKSDFAIFDHEMDVEVINHRDYKDSIIPALLSIPSIVIGISPSVFQKIYHNDSIYKTSIEIIYPDNKFSSEQIYCGIKSHSYESLKRSMRLLFKGEFGFKKFNSNILKTSPLNTENSTTQFDHLVLRAGNNHCWARRNSRAETTYTRDQWCRDTQILMSGDGVRGTFVHLYINGIYWGLYNITERPDENFLEDYYGGMEENWISLSHSNRNSRQRPYSYLANYLLTLRATGKEYVPEIKKQIDLKNYCDYLILSWFTAVADWPGNNWWAGIHSNPDGKLKFFTWDYEISIDDMSPNRTIQDIFIENYRGSFIITRIWNRLKHDKEFMLYFADRVFENCFHGWLSPDKAPETWKKLNNFLRLPIIAESARWGDAVYPVTKIRNDHWSPEVMRIEDVLKSRNTEFTEILKTVGFYPNLDPPEISISNKNKHLAVVELRNSSKTGKIYYTINGEDPRLEGGDHNPNSEIIESVKFSFTAKKGFILKARVKKDSIWSALNQFPVILQNNLHNFKISEIMFNPDSLEGVVGKNFEFLEFQNTSDEPINISGLKIDGEIKFTVPELTVLYPGQFYILAEDETWFTHRYGFKPDGIFKGKLKYKDNFSIYSGENIIIDVNYSLSKLETRKSDIFGYSIIPKRTNKFSSPQNWKFSKQKNGTPGQSNN